jgi:hypothetical protein
MRSRSTLNESKAQASAWPLSWTVTEEVVKDLVLEVSRNARSIVLIDNVDLFRRSLVFNLKRDFDSKLGRVPRGLK